MFWCCDCLHWFAVWVAIGFGALLLCGWFLVFTFACLGGLLYSCLVMFSWLWLLNCGGFDRRFVDFDLSTCLGGRCRFS